MSPLITAVICTHNREVYLRKALQSLLDQTLGEKLYEIVVVDNGSQDNTKEVVREFSGIPHLRFVHEPVVGVSRARNTAWRNAQGEYVAFLDDDAIACRGWLEKYLEVFESFAPRPGVVGGKCEAIWEAARPDWLSEKLFGYLSILDLSDVPEVLENHQWLSVCNMACPRRLLQSSGGFREDLDRQGNSLRGNSEIYFLQQIRGWGYRAIYHPEIMVGHHVSPSKLSKKWFRERAYWQGLSKAFMLYPEVGLSSARRARLGLLRIGWMLPRMVLMLSGTNAADRFRRQCQALEAAGYVKGLLRSGSYASP